MLGQGAFGVVIQACREDTGEQVAVKQIPIKVDDDRHQEKIMVRLGSSCVQFPCRSDLWPRVWWQ